MDGSESMNQEVQVGLARIYKQLLTRVERSDQSQIERILTENEIAEVIYLRDSLIQKIRSQAAAYFIEKLGSASKAAELSDRIDDEFLRPEIPAINIPEMRRRILGEVPRTVAPPQGSTTRQSSSPHYTMSEIENQKQVGRLLTIAGGAVTIFSIIKLWWLLATGGIVVTAFGIMTYADAVSKQNAAGKAAPPTSSTPAATPTITPPTQDEIQQSVRALLTLRQKEVTAMLTQMVADLYAMIDQMATEEAANA
jgi:hypothetical protein